jgi:zinc transport system ATP-binding protein
MAALLEVEGLNKWFGGLQAVNSVSFTIQEGGIVGLIGPNGSGKTTLIRLILGILKPTSGRVMLMGEEADQFTQWRRIGYVPQKATHLDIPSFQQSNW